MPVIELHIPIEQNHLEEKTAIANILAQASKLSVKEVKQGINKGALWLERTAKIHSPKPVKAKTTTKRLRRLKTKLQENDQLHFYYNSDVLAKQVDDAVLIDDFQVLVQN